MALIRWARLLAASRFWPAQRRGTVSASSSPYTHRQSLVLAHGMSQCLEAPCSGQSVRGKSRNSLKENSTALTRSGELSALHQALFHTRKHTHAPNPPSVRSTRGGRKRSIPNGVAYEVQPQSSCLARIQIVECRHGAPRILRPRPRQPRGRRSIRRSSECATGGRQCRGCLCPK